MRLGNAGSRALERRLVVLRVLANDRGGCDDPPDVERIVAVGWGLRREDLPQFSYLAHGPAPDCENGRANLAYHDLYEDVRMALRYLKQRGFVRDFEVDGYRKKWWRITDAGIRWRAEDAAAFRASVLADLDRLQAGQARA